MKTYYTIPIFIPEKACPYRCIYCNQYKIVGCNNIIHPEEMKTLINTYLSTIPAKAYKTIAFFGGSFTGMSIEEQSHYLQVAYQYLSKGEVQRIQLSTRPDYISRPILENLKRYGVNIVELGAQSLNDEVLRFIGRGHTVQQVETAAEMVKDYGFELGLQMMIGLPTDTHEGALATAKKIIDLKARNTRIYPTLVIKNTYLESLYRQGKYAPLTLEEAVSLSAEIYELFDKNHVKVLRVGLHPSEGLLNGESLVAGPFHVSFKELVLSRIWQKRLDNVMQNNVAGKVKVHVSPSQLNAAIGYGGSNRKKYQGRMLFEADETIEKDAFKIEMVN